MKDGLPSRGPRRNRQERRFNFLIATASTAAIFRLGWGTLRGTPEYLSESIPAETPHLGHGTEDSCFDVNALAGTEEDNTAQW